MSLILEALRKSEAERQLGRAPGLLSPMPVAPRRRGGWRLGAIGLLVLIAVAAAGWWLGRGGRLPDDRLIAAVEPATETTGADIDQADPPPLRATMREPAAPAPDVRPPAATPTDVAADRPPATGSSTAAVIESSALPDTVATVPVAQPPAPAVTIRATGPTAAAPASDRPATAEVVPAAIVDPPPPSLATLEGSARGRLPPLRMSLHVFSDQPTQRFALIDGRRYSEGQQVADGVEVSEIRRDGVVLAVDGRRFLLPRP